LITPKIIDSAFSHLTHSCHDRGSSLIRWDRTTPSSDYVGDLFFTDYTLGLSGRFPRARKIAWILEPRAINGHIYNMFMDNSNLPFDLVISSDIEFLNTISNTYKTEWVPVGGCWIKDRDCLVYEKTKSISIIASGKKITEGHNLRHQCIDNLGSLISGNCFGGGYNKIPYKLEGLRDYRFHIVIENSRSGGYFTEKIIDCFATGTVPIYWGDPLIGEIFDTSGMIIFRNVDHLSQIVNEILEDPVSAYESKRSGIERNFGISKEYYLSEDWMIKNKPNIFNGKS